MSIEKNRERLAIVSQERITDEFNKILLSKKPSIGLGSLNKIFQFRLMNDLSITHLYLGNSYEIIGCVSPSGSFVNNDRLVGRSFKDLYTPEKNYLTLTSS